MKEKEEIRKLILKLEKRLRNFNIAPDAPPGPLGARSAIDILTDDEVAAIINDLKTLLQ